MAEPGRRRSLSIRTRLTVVYTLALTLALGLLAVGAYVRQSRDLLRETDRGLGAQADALIPALAADPLSTLHPAHRFSDPDETFAQVLDRTGRLVDGSKGFDTVALLTPDRVRAVTAPTYLTRRTLHPEDAERLLVTPTQLAGRQVLVIAGTNLGDRYDAVHHLVAQLAVGAPAAIVMVALTGWLIAGAALRPVERMRERAARLSAEDVEARLPIPARQDELGRLAITLNELLDRIQHSRDREHRFLDQASHELRTPLAVLKAELDLALSRPRSADEFGQALRAAARETDRLVGLCEDLLAEARMRQGTLPIRPAPVHLPTLVREAVEPLCRIQPDRCADVRIACDDADCLVDPVRTRQIVHNLVTNALQHGAEPVVVTATASQDGVTLTVLDHGDGYPARCVSDPLDGIGLGVVGGIAVAHGGSLTLDNAPGARATVTLSAGPSKALTS